MQKFIPFVIGGLVVAVLSLTYLWLDARMTIRHLQEYMIVQRQLSQEVAKQMDAKRAAREQYCQRLEEAFSRYDPQDRVR